VGSGGTAADGAESDLQVRRGSRCPAPAFTIPPPIPLPSPPPPPCHRP
jgi:hypothetical protein